MKYQNTIKAILTPLIFSLILAFGIILGVKLGSNSKNDNIATFAKLNKLDVILDLVELEYVDSINKNEIIEKAIPKILEELDPHSIYISAADYHRYNDPLNGSFDGIGVYFNIQEDTVIIINPIIGGPSEKVGLLAGDRIIKVNDTTVAGVKISNDGIMEKLKGIQGTKVKLAIKRNSSDKLLDIEVVRDKIPIYSIDVAYMLDANTGYIKISRFAMTTHAEFIEAVAKLRKQNLKNIIIDLRGNGGGFIDPTIEIVDEFLNEGELIVYTEGKARPRTDYKAQKGGLCVDLYPVVLLDSWSASASEILAGALQDNGRGTIIGQRSFGKGLVQEPTMFRDGSSIRLTTARYYTPIGRCIQKSYVEGNEKYYEEILDRFHSGELLDSDSVSFPDSIKYTTTDGRILFGGGGIMPDIFVPLDTTGGSNFLTAVLNKQLIYKYAFTYSDINRKKLSSFKNITELEAFLNKTPHFENFIEYSEKNGIIAKREDIALSQEIIDNQIKAYIARNILDNDGFFPILNKTDNVINRSLKFLKNKP